MVEVSHGSKPALVRCRRRWGRSRSFYELRSLNLYEQLKDKDVAKFGRDVTKLELVVRYNSGQKILFPSPRNIIFVKNQSRCSGN
jgi:hypothetical protein